MLEEDKGQRYQILLSGASHLPRRKRDEGKQSGDFVRYEDIEAAREVIKQKPSLCNVSSRN